MNEPQEPHDWIYTFLNSALHCWDRVKGETPTNVDTFVWDYVDRCIEIYKHDEKTDD